MHDRRSEEVSASHLVARAKADAAATLAGSGASHDHGFVQLAALEDKERSHHLREAGGRMADIGIRCPDKPAVAFHYISVCGTRKRILHRVRRGGEKKRE
jgi:hypothetical protein